MPFLEAALLLACTSPDIAIADAIEVSAGATCLDEATLVQSVAMWLERDRIDAGLGGSYTNSGKRGRRVGGESRGKGLGRVEKWRRVGGVYKGSACIEDRGVVGRCGVGERGLDNQGAAG